MRKVALVLLGSAFTVGTSWIVGCGDSAGNAGGAGGAQPTTAVTTASGPSGPGATNSTSTGSGTASTSSSTGTGIPSNFDCTAAAGQVPALKLTPVASGLTGAIHLTSAPDDPDRLYVVQRHGTISIIENGQVLPQPFIDISAVVNDDGAELALWSVAFHPDYKNNGRFFVHYANKANSDNVVMEYKRSTNDLHIADPTPVQLVIEHPTAQSNHNGGALGFGPDGFLYLTMGDGGAQHDCNCDAQNANNLLGKISRVDVNGTPDAGGFPAAAGNPGGNKWYHEGLRNPWRISFDGCTGDLYVGDVGQDTWEEVDVAPANSGPLNFGWPFWEGINDPNDSSHHHYLTANNPCAGGAPTCGAEPGSGLTFPIADYHHTPECSITGGHVYRGSAIPGLRGAYFYGDYCSGKIWTVSYSNGTATPAKDSGLNPGGGVLSSFGQDGRGQVYVVGLDGNISRIDAQ